VGGTKYPKMKPIAKTAKVVDYDDSDYDDSDYDEGGYEDEEDPLLGDGDEEEGDEEEGYEEDYADGEDIHDLHDNGATGDVAEASEGENLTSLLGDGAVTGPDPSGQGFDWDTSGQWRTRVKKALDDFGQNPEALRQILAVETPAVRKHIGIGLKKLHGKA